MNRKNNIREERRIRHARINLCCKKKKKKGTIPEKRVNNKLQWFLSWRARWEICKKGRNIPPVIDITFPQYDSDYKAGL